MGFANRHSCRSVGDDEANNLRALAGRVSSGETTANLISQGPDEFSALALTEHDPEMCVSAL